ncbi:MAG: hypothetical protein ACKVS8_14500 [Phycisphaerales bacterium]
MTFRGFIQGDHVVLSQNHGLPDGTVVDVLPPVPKRRASKSPSAKKAKVIDPALRLDQFAFNTGIRDLANQHDHYIYGTPKRKPVRPAVKRKRRA